MAWIESHQDLEQHPKTILFCQKTGFTLDEALGRLHRVWWWALKYAEDGDLSKYDPSQFLVGLNGKIAPEGLYKILQEVNFIDENGQIHDWLEYAGRYLHSKYHSSNPKKWKEIRKKNKAYLKSAFRSPLGPNNLTLPNLPNQDNTFVNEVFSYFCLKTKKTIKLNDARKGIILRHKKEPLENIKKAIDNFSQDDWPERKKYWDLVYCLGVRNKVDNYEKWFNANPKQQQKLAAGI